MPTDRQIAILCDIGQAQQFDPAKLQEVETLVAEGYADNDGNAYKLTGRGEKLLVERGAGLNES